MKSIILTIVAIVLLSSSAFAQFDKNLEKQVKRGERIVRSIERGVKSGKDLVKAYKEVKKIRDEITGVDARVRIVNGYSEYSGYYLHVRSMSDNCEFLTDNCDFYTYDGKRYTKPGGEITFKTTVFPSERTDLNITIDVYEYNKELNDYFFVGTLDKEFRVKYTDRIDTYTMKKRMSLSKDDEKKKQEMIKEKKE